MDEDVSESEDHEELQTLSRNPVRGLLRLEGSSAHDIATRRLGMEPTLANINIVLRIIQDLADEADAIARAQDLDVPSLVEATAGLAARPATVQTRSNRSQRVLAICEFAPILSDPTVTNLATIIDRFGLAQDIDRSAHKLLLEQIEQFCDYLREESPLTVQAEAEMIASDLEQGSLKVLAAGEAVGHCFMTSRATSAVSGDLTAYGLRWGLAGNAAMADQTGRMVVSLLSLVPGIGTFVGGAVALNEGKSLLQLVKEAKMGGPPELPPGTTD